MKKKLLCELEQLKVENKFQRAARCTLFYIVYQLLYLVALTQNMTIYFFFRECMHEFFFSPANPSTDTTDVRRHDLELDLPQKYDVQYKVNISFLSKEFDTFLKKNRLVGESLSIINNK